MKTFAFAALAALLAAAPAFAADAPASKPKQADPNKKVCHEDLETGSRLTSKRICHTAAEEQEARQNKRDMVDGLQRGFSRCNVDPSRC
jgi:opacity protein-like surface antigen